MDQLQIVEQSQMMHDPISKSDQTPATTKMRVFVWPEGEKVLDWFFMRAEGRGRPREQYRNAIQSAVEKEVGHEVKLRWSEKAGCSMCPCSPGFIVEGVRSQYDLSFTVTPPPKKFIECI